MAAKNDQKERAKLNQETTIDEIEFEDRSDDSSQNGEEIPTEVRKLRTQPYDKAVSDLVDMIHNKDLIIDPDYPKFRYVSAYTQRWAARKLSSLLRRIF